MTSGQMYEEELNNVSYLEFKNVSKDVLEWLEKISTENNCRVEKKEWKSKYNSYVVYDYEPFCSDGFEISLTISSNSKEYVNFIRFLYEHKVNQIEYLNNCLSN